MPRYMQSSIDEVLSRSDIVDIASSYVTLKRNGTDFVALCPFHREKTPSFHISSDKQLFYCFGCNAGGDAITFLMKMQNMSYPEAVTYLAESVGMTVPTRDTFDSEITHLRKTILEMNRRAARYFHECLFQPEGKKALEYITGRGLTKNTIIRFGIGYSPAGWSGLYDKLREWGYKDEQIKASGLVVVSEREKGTTKLFDRFRGRVMFPIIDANGNVIGFGGRSMDPNDPAKYLNSPEVITFRKGNNLYAMNYAKATKRDCLILCEGYMDVIAMHQAGFDNAVAGLGTALTPEQGRLLKKYTDRVVLCYDNDEAGRKATQRSMQVLSSLDLQVRVLTLRGGKDPDEIIKKEGRAFFQALVDGSETGVDFRLNEILRRYDLSVDSERVQCSGEVFDLLASLRQDAQREIYSARAAKMLTLSDDTVKREVAKRLRNLERLRKKQQEKDENNLTQYIVMYRHIDPRYGEIVLENNVDADDYYSYKYDEMRAEQASMTEIPEETNEVTKRTEIKRYVYVYPVDGHYEAVFQDRYMGLTDISELIDPSPKVSSTRYYIVAGILVLAGAYLFFLAFVEKRTAAK